MEVLSDPSIISPLKEVADKIRKAGNLATHFNLEIETDRDTAALILDLLEYIVEYLFVMEREAHALEQRIEQL